MDKANFTCDVRAVIVVVVVVVVVDVDVIAVGDDPKYL